MKKNPDAINACQAALELAAARPWADLTLMEIGDQAELSFAVLYDVASSKAKLLELVFDYLNTLLLDDLEFDEDEGLASRDRLFDVVMQRFDTLEDYRPALLSIYKALRGDPTLLIALRRSALDSVRLVLEASGYDTSGLRGGAKMGGLMLVLAAVSRDWLKDDDPGMARTMAALDRRLRQWDRFFLEDKRQENQGVSELAETDTGSQ